MAFAGGCGGSPPPATDAAGGEGGRDGPLRFPGAPVLMVSVDTLRADRLGCYGHQRDTSPRLDAFARDAVLFEQAYANSCKTAESHMTLFTSLPPTAHGVTNASLRLSIPLREVGDNRLTLPQVLRRAGYWNAGVACGGNLIPQMGFAKGFEGRFRSELRDVSRIVDDTLAALDLGLGQERPLFLFSHTYQVHGPYAPPPEHRKRFVPELGGPLGARVAALEGLPLEQQGGLAATGFWDGVESFGPDEARLCSDLYDGEVSYTDEELGRLLDGLKARGVYDRMLIVVLSDHGEEFAEHGGFEHDQLYRESLHVPLMVKLPGGAQAGRRVAGLVSLIDVMPTLLELLGLPGPAPQMMGRSLVPALAGAAPPDRPVLSERIMFPGAYVASLRGGGLMTCFREDRGALELYDTAADPGETVDLAPPPAGSASTGPTGPASAGSAEPRARKAFESAAGALHRQIASLFALRVALDAEAGGKRIELSPEILEELSQLNYTGGAEDLPLPSGTPLERWPAGGPK